MKKNVIIISVITILAFSLGVGAATIFKAKDVSYTPKDENWEVNNLNDAIDDLYDIGNIQRTNIINALNNKGFTVDEKSNYNEIAASINETEISSNENLIFGFSTHRSRFDDFSDNTKINSDYFSYTTSTNNVTFTCKKKCKVVIATNFQMGNVTYEYKEFNVGDKYTISDTATYYTSTSAICFIY